MSYKNNNRYKKPAKKRYNKKRKSYKRQYKRSNRMTSRNMGLIMPDKARIKFKYNDTATSMTQNGTTHWYLRYKANDIVQPGNLNFGNFSNLFAPNGVEQWENFYRKFKVNASKISVHVMRNHASSTDDTTYQQVVVRPCTEEGLIAFQGDNSQQAITDKYSRSKILGNSTGKESSVYIKNYMSTKKIYGYHYDNLDTSESLIGELGVPPLESTELWYWIITLGSFDGTIPTATDPRVLISVNITYYVDLFDRYDTDMVVLN